MTLSPRRRVLLFSLAVYIIMVVLSTWMMLLKRDSLQFHTRDYNYFVEFAARLSDPNLSNRFALNIEGFNFLGLQGIEGETHITQAIHVSFFRYTYIPIYWIFRSPLPIFIYYSLIFFFPILYIALIPRPGQAKVGWQVPLFILLYALMPVTIPTVTADLRERMIFPAAWCLMALAIQYDRPFLEKLLFFALLLSVREEGVPLGLLLVTLNFFKMQGKPRRWLQTVVFGLMNLAALVVFLFLMDYWGYHRVDNNVDPARMVAALLDRYGWFFIVLGVLLAVLIAYVWRKKRSQFKNLLLLLVYLAAVLMVALQLYRSTMGWLSVNNTVGTSALWDYFRYIFSNASTALFFYFLLMLLVLLPDYISGQKWHTALRAFLLLGCAGSVFMTRQTVPEMVKQWQGGVAPAHLVWEFKTAHDRYQTNVLLDYSTYQAFYDYEKILVYNRLPLWLVSPHDRFYPDNKDYLAFLIRDRMEYAVISRDSLADVLELTRLADRTAVELAANDRYIVLQFR